MVYIINSLDIGLPLLCRGRDGVNGHVWVIDGYKIYACTMKNEVTGETADITDYFFHCNLGWEGSCDGYYRSCIFNTQNIPNQDRNVSIYRSGYIQDFFRYKLYTVSHIWHAK